MILVAGVLAIAAVAGAAALTSTPSSSQSQCTLPAPAPSLPPVLRSLGDFDQTYDAGDAAQLTDTATRVAGALHPELVGLIADPPVREAPKASTGYPAIVIPLGRRDGGGGRSVIALVAFRVDCAGRAYYWETQTTPPGPNGPANAFPAISKDRAQLSLRASVTLAYAQSPFAPVWRTAAGQQIAAT